MLAAAAASANLASTSHPAVAVLLGLGAVVVAVVTVAMAWSVHARQIQLAETLARRQYGFATAPAAAQPDAAPADRNDDGADGANGATGPAGPAGPSRRSRHDTPRHRHGSAGRDRRPGHADHR